MIHKTAIIQKGAKVHPEASIGPYCTIGKNVEIGRLEMQENWSGRDRPKGKGKGRETNEETSKQKRRQQGQPEPGLKDRTQYQDSWEKVKINENKTDWKITGINGEGNHTDYILKQISVKETQKLQEGPPRLVLTTREHVVSCNARTSADERPDDQYRRHNNTEAEPNAHRARHGPPNQSHGIQHLRTTTH